MRIRPEQLTAQLERQLAPIYLIHGDEPLLALEAADAVRRAARAAGCSEREVLSVEPGFDWHTLLASAASGSLFATRRLLELRLASAKPGDAGGKALRAYAERPPPDVTLLISADKLDQNSQKSRWFAALERTGVNVQVWPIEPRQLPAWIERRLRARQLLPSPEAVKLLAARFEGNLLAAAQEIDKLYLLYGPGPVDAAQLLAVIADSARYSIYDLADAALAGRAARAVRILDCLHDEGAEPVLILWALAREIRLLIALQFAINQGDSVATALTGQKVWEKRKALLGTALQRLPATQCRQLLQVCARLDRVIKGINAVPQAGDIWDELQTLALALAGKPLRTL